jgi:kynurenine formamidase
MRQVPWLHRYAFLNLMENLFLEDLARDQVYEFLFVCLPLKIQGATGSQIRPVAVVPQRERKDG